MGITHKWSGNGLSASALTTSVAGVGDTAFDVVSGTITVASYGPRPPALSFPDNGNYCRWTYGAGRSVAAYRGFWTAPAAVPSGVSYIFRLKLAGANSLSIGFTATGNIRVYQSAAGGNTQVGIQSADITLGQTYRVELIINHGNGTTTGTATLNIYRLDGSLLDSIGITGANFGATHDSMQLGSDTAGNTIPTYYWDDVASSDTAVLIGDVVTMDLAARLLLLTQAIGADIKTITNRKRMTYDLPTGYSGSTLGAPRSTHLVNNLGILTTQREYLQQIYLEAGTVVTNISFFSGGTGVATPTNYWFTLRDLNRVLLARTNDQLTAAWGNNAEKKLALQSTYTVTTSGLFYVGLMVKATTVPTLVGNNRVAYIDTLAPIVQGQTADTGLTTTPPSTAGAITPSTGMALAMTS